MSAQRSLQEEFPDIDPEVYRGDENAARLLLEQMRMERDAGAVQCEELVNQLCALFPLDSREELVHDLRAFDWNIERAAAAAAARTLSKTVVSPSAPAQTPVDPAVVALRGVFGTSVSDSEIAAALQRHNGNADQAVNELLETRAAASVARNAEAAVAAETQSRMNLVDSICQHFPVLAPSAVESALRRHGWDHALAADDLVLAAEEGCLSQLQPEFSEFSAETVRRAIISQSWRLPEAREELRKERARRQEVVEAEKRRADAEKRRADAEKRNAEAQAAALAQVEALQAAEKEAEAAKEAEAVQRRLREEVERRRLREETERMRLLEEAEAEVRRCEEEQARLEEELRKAEAAAAAAEMSDEEVLAERMRRSVLLVQSVVAEAAVESAPQLSAGPVADDEDDVALVRSEAENASDAPAPYSVDDDAVAEPSAASVLGTKLTVDREVYDAGATVTVSFKYAGDGVSSSSEWVGLYRLGRDARQYSTYEYMPMGASGGTVKLTAKKDGYYVVRLVTKSLQVLSASAPFRVGPVYKVTVEPADARMAVVRTELVSGVPSTSAWIGVYANASDDSRQYISYHYRDSSGSQTIAVPKAGTWQVRLFSDSSYHPMCDASFTTVGTDSLNIMRSGNTTTILVRADSYDLANDRLWVGLFNVSMPMDSTSPHRWNRLSAGALEPSFKTPQTKGTYHARLFTYASSEPVLVSEDLLVIA